MIVKKFNIKFNFDILNIKLNKFIEALEKYITSDF